LFETENPALELGSPQIGVGRLGCGCAEIREETAGRVLRERGVSSMAIP
jgi:hypothetical protein